MSSENNQARSPLITHTRSSYFSGTPASTTVSHLWCSTNLIPGRFSSGHMDIQWGLGQVVIIKIEERENNSGESGIIGKTVFTLVSKVNYQDKMKKSFVTKRKQENPWYGEIMCNRTQSPAGVRLFSPLFTNPRICFFHFVKDIKGNTPKVSRSKLLPFFFLLYFIFFLSLWNNKDTGTSF